jgi:glutathione synthase/RimK-type ligase-like ATP-grasp enzyme
MHVHLLTCAELPDLYPDDHILRDALRTAGHTVSVGVWGDSLPTETTAAVVRSCWDYFGHQTEFLRFLDGLVVPVYNHPALIRWNSDKAYLKHMEDEGCVIVPTSFDGTLGNITADEIVVKPRVSNGGHGLWKCRRNEFTPEAVGERYGDRKLLIQPFLPSIAEGEYSVILIAGQLTHVVHKQPAAGEFRVQHYHGGRYARVDKPSNTLRWHTDLAYGSLCALTGKSPLYVRFDFIMEREECYLSEVEAIDPLLHFDLCPEAASRMVRALELRHAATE